MAFRLYLGFLAALLLAFAYLAVTFSAGPEAKVWVWLVLIILFGLAESVPLHFHHESGRQSLGAGEAVLVPMLVALTLPQLFFGIIGVMSLIAIVYWRQGPVKLLFNVAQYGICSAIAGFVFHWLDGTRLDFTLRTAGVALLSVLVYAFLSHALVAGAIALTEGRPILKLLRGIASAAHWSLAASLALGLLFSASYAGADWTVALFIFPLAALYLGYRAVVRQSRERDRVESLHAASRALASGATLDDALAGFVGAMREIVSSAEARVVVNVNRQWFMTSARADGVKEVMTLLEAGPFLTLVEHFRASPDALVVSEDDQRHSDLLSGIGARSFVGVPLMNGAEFAGCLLAMDRLGAEDFGENEAKLLEALGNELVLTLDSYRLFAQVAEERERFQQIFAGSKEGICLLDEDGVIRAWNPALARITGFDEDDIIGERWSERVLVRDRYHRRVEGMDIVSVPPEEELEIVTRKGPPRWVAIISGEVPTEDKKSWVLLVRDITAEHELEESKSDFLSTISHELRTPLTTIKGSLQVLSRPNASANSEIGKQMVEIMKRGSDRLERLVMNLLAVSQMEAGDVQVYPDEVALEDLVRSRIASVLPDHPQVEVVMEEDIAVRADRERLAQVIEHLLDNARKFGPESGTIMVEMTKENGYAVLSVSDEGPGIPKIDQERIFDRFVRLGHVLTRETQGPGVGLFIVKRSIEAMSGSVEVESDPGQGTTFHLRIPLAYPMAAIDSAS